MEKAIRDFLELFKLINSLVVIELFCLIALTLLAYFYLKPINIIKDLSDVGYDHLMKNIKNCKSVVVQKFKTNRVVGDLPPVFPNGWFAILDSSDIQPNDVKYITALGEHFAVFRSESKDVHILSAFCPHMGANLAVGGIVNGNCIQCPFHGWNFNGATGECISIPYSNYIPEKSNVKRWLSYEINALIFVWYHAEDEAPSWYPERIPEINTWWYRGRNEYYVNCHIQEIPENGADVKHLSILHGPIVFAGSNLNTIRKWWANLAVHNWKVSWMPLEEKGKEHMSTMHLTTDTVFFNMFSGFKMAVRADQIGPGYVVMNIQTSIGPMIIIQTVIPVEPLLQKVVHKMYYPFAVSLYGTLTFFTESILFERDVIIWNHKRYERSPLLTKEENSIAMHRRWYNQFYSDNSPKFKKNNLDW